MRNPLPGPKHALPIGFVQSPLLATLVLLKSNVREAIERAIAKGVTISVYLDDFVGSHNDPAVLAAAYDDIRQTCVDAGFIPDPNKLVPPTAAITVFKCNLTKGRANVTDARFNEYLARPNRSVNSDVGFLDYAVRVEAMNVP